MSLPVFLILFIAAGFALLALAIRLRQGVEPLAGYRLHFSRGLDEAAVTGFLSGICGWLRPWWRRWIGNPVVILEVHATVAGIEHYVLVEHEWQRAVENLLQGSVPSVRYDAVDVPLLEPKVGAEYRLSTNDRPLRVDAPALATKLLTNLSPLTEGETVAVQWIISPVGPVSPPRVAGAPERGRMLQRPGTVPDGEAATALRRKQEHPLLFGNGRIGATAPSLSRARRLLRDVEGGWHETRAPGVHLRRSLLPERLVARRLTHRFPSVLPGGTYNVAELAGLVGWPIGDAQFPGLVLGGCRPLAASPLVPTTGTVIGESNFPGSRRRIALSTDARLRHVHVVGPTGTGKSTLLLGMLEQDLAAGKGVALLDFKGDLVSDLLARVPDERRSDVIVLDPADDAPVGLNPLASINRAHAEVVVENLVGLFRNLWGSTNWGPRSDDLMRGALRTLALSGGYTLCEVIPLFLDANFRRRLVAKLDDVSLQQFWAWFDSVSEAERINITAAPINKLRAFVMRPQVRAIVGQVNPAISLPDILANNKVLLVSLAAGLIGTEAAQLLGGLTFSEVWHATLGRAAVPASRRQPFAVFLDEAQHVSRLPTALDAVLAESRGLSVGYVVSHQHLGQLTRELQAAVLANPRSRIVFQVGASDARVLTRELGPAVTADDLMGLAAYEVMAQVFSAGRTQSPLTARTFPPSTPIADPDDARQASRARYGVARATVEAEIQARQVGPVRQAPIGRRRRDQAGGVS